MAITESGLESSFLDRQQARLKALHAELLEVKRSQESETVKANEELHDQAHEYEDDAQKLTALELQVNLRAVEDERLSNVARALIKIQEGSYGLSDRSGKRIPVERLEASPESIYTLEEQEARDEVL